MNLVEGGALAAIVLLAYTTQAMAGFGSTVLSVTLAALWLPLPWIMPIVVTLNVPFSVWLAWRERRHVDRRRLVCQILPLMLLGAFGGGWISLHWGVAGLKPLYGGFIVTISLLDIYRSRRRQQAAPGGILRRVMILGAGVVQGLYASGGPLLVVALGGGELSKSAMRATLLCVWSVVNSALIAGFIVSDRYSASMYPVIVGLFPITLAGLWLGNHLHHRMDERQYRLAINVLLIVAGLALMR